MLRWSSRCLPGFSILILVSLLFLAFSDHLGWDLWRRWTPARPRKPDPDLPHGLNLAQLVFAIYTVVIHLNMFTFTIRLLWSLFWVTRKTQQVFQRRSILIEGASTLDLTNNPLLDLSDMHSPLAGESIPKTQTDELVHAIIVPNYREDVDTLRTTLSVLASHPNARSHYEIYLAMEEKEATAVEKAMKLGATFDTSFRSIQTTFHPYGIDGEIPGKGSNVAFAARYIVDVHHEALRMETCNIIITVIDADTHLARDYFTEIQRIHDLNPTEAERTLYCCPIIFDRNSNESPVLVRCADLLWGFAGLSTMYPGTVLAIPTSVYSLSLSLAEKVGGWDSDPTSIGEDMHMLLKCYFETAGNLITQAIYVPASQCNVSSDARRGWRRVLDTCIARYRQALRHMWGALDSGFALRRTVGNLRFHRRCFVLRPRQLALLHLLWEAHFLPCHVTILLAFSVFYTLFNPTEHLHPTLAFAFSSTNTLRTLSFIGMNLAISLYEGWHTLCVETRMQDMQIANISGTGCSRRAWYTPQCLLERVTFPIAGTLFGAVPTLHAAFSHFWTDRLEYRVSKKPCFESEVMIISLQSEDYTAGSQK
ncbi:glycosyltransferase family 2 protein [Aspergillus ibericus CBS 121593]|uniref:Glycosyltransferase 2-like domain-containing protein n=1 Tax=Aspergillus ibericus CBS 121593 TaxID=1448316 RepID=A0A395HC00_9EURO|nr:hypothetical protein BO80DRAFT_483112 [Aspergillus ibericus CBS 121593]RAL04665.1 hypothetical protein BO80DRAFT_483112 [Aspergillus ibericus CBS 121593]